MDNKTQSEKEFARKINFLIQRTIFQEKIAYLLEL